jgi:hypothetical protein
MKEKNLNGLAKFQTNGWDNNGELATQPTASFLG